MSRSMRRDPYGQLGGGADRQLSFEQQLLVLLRA